MKQDVNVEGYKLVYILLRDYFHTLAPGTAYIFTQNYRPYPEPFALIRITSERSGFTGNTVCYPVTIASTAVFTSNRIPWSPDKTFRTSIPAKGPSGRPRELWTSVTTPHLSPWGRIDFFHLYHCACFPGRHLANHDANQGEEPRFDQLLHSLIPLGGLVGRMLGGK